MGRVVGEVKYSTLAHRTEKEIISDIIRGIKQLHDKNVIGIGIGVPGLLDMEKGIVYDVNNIPSWKEVHLKEQVEALIDKSVHDQ